MEQKPRILFLGAGYGCISTIKGLKNQNLSKAHITLINNNNYHYHTILLHDIAAGVSRNDVKYPLKQIVPENIDIVIDEVVEITQDKVITKQSSYEYDYLVIGLGFESDSFGIKGIEENSLNISSFDSAENIKKHIDSKLYSYQNTKDPNDLSFIVCGGGFTGIEFVSSLAQELENYSKKNNFSFEEIKIYCIEAMPHILPMFDITLSQKAFKRLEKLGVKVLENSKILECQKDGVIIENNGEQKKIQAHTIIWSAGVKGNQVILNSSYFQSTRNKIAIDDRLHPIQELPNREKIFVVGDCGALSDPISKRFYPPTAQLANKQGQYLCEIINGLLEGKNINKAFSFQAGDSICSLGKGYAIGIAKGIKISGFIASGAKDFIEKSWEKRIKK